MPPDTSGQKEDGGRWRGRKFTPSRDNKTQIIVATIGAAATVAAAVIAAVASSSHSSPSLTAGSPTAPQSPAATAPSPATTSPDVGPAGYRPLPGTIPETEEEPGGAQTFTNYASLAQGDRIANGVTVAVYCRVPGNSNSPESVGKAGWYKIMDLDHKIGYVGANTFYNDPGNGFGASPYPAPYDPRVPICSGG